MLIQINQQQLRIIRQALEAQAAAKGLNLSAPREYMSGNDDHELAILIDLARDSANDADADNEASKLIHGWCL